MIAQKDKKKSQWKPIWPNISAQDICSFLLLIFVCLFVFLPKSSDSLILGPDWKLIRCFRPDIFPKNQYITQPGEIILLRNMLLQNKKICYGFLILTKLVGKKDFSTASRVSRNMGSLIIHDTILNFAFFCTLARFFFNPGDFRVFFSSISFLS